VQGKLFSIERLGNEAQDANSRDRYEHCLVGSDLMELVRPKVTGRSDGPHDGVGEGPGSGTFDMM
jgi:hypothetical protein